MDANKFFLWLSRYGKCWETGDSNEITNVKNISDLNEISGCIDQQH